MIFLSPFFLTFSFYLFYAVCENFNTKGTILWKIRGVWSWEVSFFLYFLYKPRISHNFCLDNANDLKLSHKQDNNETNIFWFDPPQDRVKVWRRQINKYTSGKHSLRTSLSFKSSSAITTFIGGCLGLLPLKHCIIHLTES